MCWPDSGRNYGVPPPRAAPTGDPAAAVRATLAASGRAVVLTTGLVTCGVAVLLFSDFVPTRRFAELVCVTLTAALASDLTLLPAALTRFWPRS